MTFCVVSRLAVMPLVCRVQVHKLGMVAAAAFEVHPRNVVDQLTAPGPFGGSGLIVVPSDAAAQICHPLLLSGSERGPYGKDATLQQPCPLVRRTLAQRDDEGHVQLHVAGCRLPDTCDGIVAGQTRVRMSRSVSRVLSMGSVTGTPVRGHPSTTAVADSLLRSTRELGRATLERSRSPDANAGPS